jgi:hypothetical protein
LIWKVKLKFTTTIIIIIIIIIVIINKFLKIIITIEEKPRGDTWRLG